MNSTDHLHIQGLTVVAHIGVPDAERQFPQHLKLNVTLWPSQPLTGLNDELHGTIDYAAVADHLYALSATKPRKLIETLAEELIDSLLVHFPVQRVQLQIEKFILPATDYVRVSLTKSRPQV
jgi:dihydroneopterin aldolase